MADDGEKTGALEHAIDEKGTTAQPESEIRQQHGGRPACFKTTFQEILFIFIAAMACGMASFTAGAVTAISAIIGSHLHMTNAQITWLTAAAKSVQAPHAL